MAHNPITLTLTLKNWTAFDKAMAVWSDHFGLAGQELDTKEPFNLEEPVAVSYYAVVDEMESLISQVSGNELKRVKIEWTHQDKIDFMHAEAIVQSERKNTYDDERMRLFSCIYASISKEVETKLITHPKYQIVLETKDACGLYNILEEICNPEAMPELLQFGKRQRKIILASAANVHIEPRYSLVQQWVKPNVDPNLMVRGLSGDCIPVTHVGNIPGYGIVCVCPVVNVSLVSIGQIHKYGKDFYLDKTKAVCKVGQRVDFVARLNDQRLYRLERHDYLRLLAPQSLSSSVQSMSIH